jgi:outer membrane receptor protein involved in Fe transport
MRSLFKINSTCKGARIVPISRLLGAVLVVGLWALAVAPSAHSQNVGRVAGTVTDAVTGEALPGVNVVIVGTTQGSATGADGGYYILNIPPGRYDLRASMIGYESMLVEGVVVNAGRTTTVNFQLPEEALMGEELVVVAQRPDVERDKTATSHIVRFDDVEGLPGIRDISDVLNLTGDVVDGHFRGGRVGEELYMLQGMGIVNPLDNSAAFMPIMSAVEEVEVITSGFGAQFGNAQSGVVRISMREGHRSRWETRMEARSRAPGRRHFGPSVFDPQANQYLRLLLLEGDIWLRGDPGADDPQPFYGTMASGLTGYFGGDTLAQLAMAQALYAQSRRDVDRGYGQEVDYSVELATGGPINQRMRMFMAFRTREQWEFLPTERPNREYQTMGNVVTDLWEGGSLRISGALSHESNNIFPGVNSVGGYQRWLWDRVVGTRQQRRVNAQIGARLTHLLSQSTFYELQLNTLHTDNRVGSSPVPGFIPDSIAVNWAVGTISFPNNNFPDRINYQIGNDQFNDQRSRTISFDGSFTSQLTPAHQLNAGVQLNSYFLDVDNYLNARSTRLVENYQARPFEGAVYLQDKMEFEGMIANAGLRLDVWYSGVDHFVDLYTPFGEPDSLGRFNPGSALMESPPVHTRLQPRLGVSFPITALTVFHFNYGSFMQRPSFQYIVSRRLGHRLSDPVILGNPTLRPETTTSYDVGVVQALGNGFTLDVSGYYKDVNNLIQQANFVDDRAGYQVSSYFNLDYANVRGFRLALARRTGQLTGSLNYQYSFATGKSPNATAATPIFSRDTTGVVTTDLTNVPTRDIVLDFDRQHNLILTTTYATPRNFGPGLGGIRPLANLAVSVFSTGRSGRPYTSPSDIRLVNALRTPAEFNTDLRLTRRLDDLTGMPGRVYFEVFNLFNDRILNYNYLFQRPTATNPNLALQYYEQFGIDDPASGVRYWWDKGRQGPFAIDQSFLIYSNAPRSFSLGLVVDL